MSKMMRVITPGFAAVLATGFVGFAGAPSAGADPDWGGCYNGVCGNGNGNGGSGCNAAGACGHGDATGGGGCIPGSGCFEFHL